MEDDVKENKSGLVKLLSKSIRIVNKTLPYLMVGVGFIGGGMVASYGDNPMGGTIIAGVSALGAGMYDGIVNKR